MYCSLICYKFKYLTKLHPFINDLMLQMNINFILRFLFLSNFYALTLCFSSVAQPIQSCYIGAYLGCGSEDISCISVQDFNAATGKPHYCFSRYINANDNGDLLNSGHWLWADTLKSLGAKPVFFLMPIGNLQDYYNGTKDSVFNLFAQSASAFQDTVYIIFGHEMNGIWYDWGHDSANYIPAFRHVSTLLKNSAANIRMCWVPTQAWGQDAYAPYYPGDTYVDWVGMTFYDRDWDENNILGPGHIKAGLNYLNFYQQFSVISNKPMLIAETAYFDPNLDPTPTGVQAPLSDSLQCVNKNEWLTQLYDTVLLSDSFQNLNMIIYFNVLKNESAFESGTHNFGTIAVDWRICTAQYNLYSSLIDFPYFQGMVLNSGYDADKSENPNGKAYIRVFPNPASFIINIEFYLPKMINYELYVNNSNNQKVDTIKYGAEVGLTKINYSMNLLAPGFYYIILETRDYKKCVKIINK